MEILGAAHGLYFLGEEDGQYFLNINGRWAPQTLQLTDDEVATFHEEGRAFIDQLAAHYGSGESIPVERRVPDRVLAAAAENRWSSTAWGPL